MERDIYKYLNDMIYNMIRKIKEKKGVDSSKKDKKKI